MSTVATYHHASIGLLGHSSNSSLEQPAQSIDRFSPSVTWQRTREATDTVIDVFRKHRDPGWDGYNAAPISELACNEAVKFLRRLPSTIPMPEVVAEPDGDIAFEWYMKRRLLFVVSFSGVGVISYAGMFGKGSKVHGSEYFLESIPPSIIENIRRLWSRA
jgi:hypothetical protein